jgi:hypothetical protein
VSVERKAKAIPMSHLNPPPQLITLHSLAWIGAEASYFNSGERRRRKKRRRRKVETVTRSRFQF